MKIKFILFLFSLLSFSSLVPRPIEIKVTVFDNTLAHPIPPDVYSYTIRRDAVALAHEDVVRIVKTTLARLGIPVIVDRIINGGVSATAHSVINLDRIILVMAKVVPTLPRGPLPLNGSVLNDVAPPSPHAMRHFTAAGPPPLSRAPASLDIDMPFTYSQSFTRDDLARHYPLDQADPRAAAGPVPSPSSLAGRLERSHHPFEPAGGAAGARPFIDPDMRRLRELREGFFDGDGTRRREARRHGTHTAAMPWDHPPVPRPYEFGAAHHPEAAAGWSGAAAAGASHRTLEEERQREARRNEDLRLEEARRQAEELRARERFSAMVTTELNRTLENLRERLVFLPARIAELKQDYPEDERRKDRMREALERARRDIPLIETILEERRRSAEEEEEVLDVD